MVKSTDDVSFSKSPFLLKCYDMVDDESTNSIISWSTNNDRSFVIWDMTEFSVKLLPNYFKHNNFSSFIRQLNIYGFKKIDSDRWEFENEGFVRGQKHLLKNISRRKNSSNVNQGKQLHEQDKPPGKIENFALREEVENLKNDKNAIMQELVKLRDRQEAADSKLVLLKDRLHGMEKDQQQILSFVVMAMQSPSFFIRLLQPKENNLKMTEFDTMLTEEVEPVHSNGMIVPYRTQTDGTMPVLNEVTGSENLQETVGTKDFTINADFLKVLMDESYVPFIPPDLLDYGAWDQLLLASPSKDSMEDPKVDEEDPLQPETAMDSEEVSGEKSCSFELALQEIEKCLDLENELPVDETQLENFKTMKLSTENMDLLASDVELPDTVERT